MTVHSRTQAAAFPPSNKPWTVRRRTSPAQVMPALSQRYHISWLAQDGCADDFVRMGPAIPLFTQAFTALTRGAILATTDGPMAVEDVLPGMAVQTASGPQKLLWKGSHNIQPGTKGKPLYRVPADAMGLGRPSPDLVLGPAARIVSRRSSLRSLIGADAALVPVQALEDGQSVIQITPLSAVQCFHLGFAKHQTFTVNGIDVESLHPGKLDPSLGDDMQRFYLAMFPHIDQTGDFGELSMARLSEEQAQDLVAA